jgi:CRP-like cAMP-binding protein
VSTDLLEVLATSVPLFHGLTQAQVRLLIPICGVRPFEAGEVLIQTGSQSSDMYLVLVGAMVVKTEEGAVLARLSRMETAGEMALITGGERSATVEGLEKGLAGVISRYDLSEVLGKHPELAQTIYRNVAGILSRRLRNENYHIQALQNRVEDLEEKLGVDQMEGLAEEDVPIEESEITRRFYQAIGIEEVSGERRKRDHVAYVAMRQLGRSDNQIMRTALWVVRNIRRVKEFTLVRYCIDEALADEDSGK